MRDLKMSTDDMSIITISADHCHSLGTATRKDPCITSSLGAA